MTAFQNQRLIQLRKMLLNGRLINQSTAAKLLDCHPRTVRRLLNELKNEGLDFSYSFQLKRYVFINKN
ncbi:MAG: helix-turn-helix domain-containing protein [Pelobium sp.]